MTEFWTSVLEFAQEVTAQVGKQLLEDFGQAKAEQKSDGSLVTASDKWADVQIRQAIASKFPDHGILTEEGNTIFPGTEWCWVVDPIDGTTNFTRGIPIWGISMGLLYRGVPVFGYVDMCPLYQVFHGYWSGETGLDMPSGAFCNGKPIKVSQDSPSSQHFFNLCSRSTDVIEPDFPCKIRMLGVATYNFLSVATGAVLGGIEATPKTWDIAAIWAITQAAGATWVSSQLEPFPLVKGENYAAISYPTMVLSRSELVSVFKPYLGKLKL
ncbi:inositol monophosphatase family protein [Calothrix sp. 336/3]|uniref:inositol monophosphatase family protein n=1 Tax=Calothrix sp. 336/3 TaxID=1337936 RepID=UPI0004E45609|nr:inositol monophosphatase family protein [Calothrix sp. 336/3]AKG22232.1 inositol monophosphatase [Calothrix sp. 336/3]